MQVYRSSVPLKCKLIELKAIKGIVIMVAVED
jgi:hypothetical protein